MNSADNHVESLHFALYQLFRSVASLARFLPDRCITPLFVFLKYLFLFILGFAAWVRSFSDTSIGLWLVIGFVICSLLHSYFGRSCLYPNERCKVESVKEDVAKNYMKKEMSTQKNIHDALEQVKITLEKKSKLDHEIEEINDHWKEKLASAEKRAEDLEEELLLKEEENGSIRDKFKKEISMLNDSVWGIKNIEEAKKSLEDLMLAEKAEKMEHENAKLRGNIDLLTKQRQTLHEKHSFALRQIEELLNQKTDLEQRLVEREALENIEKEKLKEVQKLTDKLSNALGNAKGRLTRAQSVLAVESDRSQTTSPASQRRRNTKFSKK